jgi:hypothetical protein
MKFTTKLLSAGKTATGIEVPAKVVEALGSHKRPPVRVTIGPHTYRSTVAVMGGKYMIGVSAENRAAAGVQAGDTLTINLELDAGPRTVTVPPDLKKALARDAKAKAFFDGLTYSQQQWYVLPLEQAKKPETRERRLDKAVTLLREGRKP